MTIENPIHQQIQQLLPLVPSGMLTDAERQQVDQHIAVCEACRATLDQLIAADRELAELFAPVNPPLGFEERVLSNWRPARFNISLRPGSRKAIAAAAAAILLGTVGYVGAELMESNRLPGAAPMPQAVAIGTAPDKSQSVVSSGKTEVSSSFGTPEEQQRTVVQLVKTSQQLTREGQFKKAQGVINQILTLDPSNEYATGVRQLVADQVVVSEQKEGREEFNLQEQRQLNSAEDRKVPYLEIMRYPDNWPDIAEMRDRDRSQGLSEKKSLADETRKPGDTNADFYANGRWDQSGSGVIAGDRWFDSSESRTLGRPTIGTVLLGDGDRDGTVASEPAFATGKPVSGATSLQLGTIVNNPTAQGLDFTAPTGGADAAGKTGGETRGRVKARIDVVDAKGKPNLAVADAGHFKLSGLNAWGLVVPAEKQEAEKLGRLVVTNGTASLGAIDGKAMAGRTQTAAGVAVSEDTEATVLALKQRVEPLGAKEVKYHATVLFADGAGSDVPPVGTTPTKVESPVPQAPEASVVQQRKIIRNGDMEFDVDSFDTAFATISRIVGEEKGYVSSTSSEKLPNGKVRGVIVVRITPDRLDTLVLKLRALGDLKSQKISAQDITKVYYDLDSELRAARTMEERIINIIKSGKGEVKDLIEAEKQLGAYREKIEKLEGEIRYYNNMVSLSTLNITAAEKAISSPATVQVTENVNTGIETDDVEKARADAIKGIEELKGRVVDSNLKKYDGGQLAANITAEVSPEASGQLIDRLRQIGRVTRLDIDRKQTSAGQALPGAPAPRVEKKDTRFVISLYNLANIAPRQTTTSSMAVANVEEAYKAIIASVKTKGGRVVSSNLNRQKPEQTTAAISFEVPGDQADATLLELRREREVMSLSVTENPDTQNATSAKHGFSLQLQSLASVAPRETESIVLVSKVSVNDAFRKLLDDLRKSEARILTSQLNEQDASNLSGNIDIEVTRAKETEARAALASAGAIFSRTVARSSDTESTVDIKIRLQVRMVGQNQLAPAQTARLNVETPDVETRAGELKNAAVQFGGRVVDSRQMTSAAGQVTSRLVLEVPLAKASDLRAKAQDAGRVRTTDSTQNPAMADSPLARARLEVSLTNASPIVSDDSGLGAAFRKAVATSIRGLLWSVQAIIIGALIVIPWAAILWGGWKIVRRRKATVQS